ncbi:hypothetical protein [Brevifollis gellanilyticus]|nr:hypothetical protein [Brevifollis gellanilyticus]
MSPISIRPGNLQGTTGSSEVSVPKGKLGGDEVVVMDREFPKPPKSGGLRHESGVHVGSKALIERESSRTELSTPRGKISAIQQRVPTEIGKDEVAKAMKDIVDDPRLEQSKESTKPKSYWNKFVDYFASGRFLKLLPQAIAGPVWSLIEGAKAERHQERMVAISHDAGARSEEGGVHDLPRELASAMSGHYQHKAQKHSDKAMIGTVGLVVTPVTGPLFASLGGVVGGVTSEVVGTAVEKGGAGLVSLGARKGVQFGLTEPMRDKERRMEKSETFHSAAHLSVELDSEGNSAEIARTSRGFLKYLSLPPDKERLNSDDPKVRQQELSRLTLKRAMGGDVNTDYSKETRTTMDQLEKRSTSGTSTPLSSSDGMSWVPVGVGSKERSTDYLRRMLVCEGMMEHSEESLNVKDR